MNPQCTPPQKIKNWYKDRGTRHNETKILPSHSCHSLLVRKPLRKRPICSKLGSWRTWDMICDLWFWNKTQKNILWSVLDATICLDGCCRSATTCDMLWSFPYFFCWLARLSAATTLDSFVSIVCILGRVLSVWGSQGIFVFFVNGEFKQCHQTMQWRKTHFYVLSLNCLTHWSINWISGERTAISDIYI